MLASVRTLCWQELVCQCECLTAIAPKRQLIMSLWQRQWSPLHTCTVKKSQAMKNHKDCCYQHFKDPRFHDYREVWHNNQLLCQLSWAESAFTHQIALIKLSVMESRDSNNNFLILEYTIHTHLLELWANTTNSWKNPVVCRRIILKKVIHP